MSDSHNLQENKGAVLQVIARQGKIKTFNGRSDRDKWITTYRIPTAIGNDGSNQTNRYAMTQLYLNIFGRRLALETLGANNLISEHTIVRSHDRSLPLQVKMFTSSNYGKRSFCATDAKVVYSHLD